MSGTRRRLSCPTPQNNLTASQIDLQNLWRLRNIMHRENMLPNYVLHLQGFCLTNKHSNDDTVVGLRGECKYTKLKRIIGFGWSCTCLCLQFIYCWDVVRRVVGHRDDGIKPLLLIKIILLHSASDHTCPAKQVHIRAAKA
jgi:hypothetical protein